MQCGRQALQPQRRAFGRRSPGHVLTVPRVSQAPSAATTSMHRLPDGQELEVVTMAAAAGSGSSSSKPPLLFVHGSYHSAWCWQEHFMPYFSQRGFDTVAVSLRAQGGSSKAPGAKVGGTLDSHAADLGSFVGSLQQPPVLVGHSFGGLIAQNYLATQALPALAGAAFLCSVPPSGNQAMVGRFLKKDLLLSLKITWALVAKSFARSEAACRETFFSPDLPAADLQRYQRQLAACSEVRLLDLKDMQARTPLPAPPRGHPPAFVLGAAGDAIVDEEAVRELGRWAGAAPVVLPGMAHDVMLDTRWQEAAAALETWLASHW